VKNFEKGYKEEKGHQVLHFQEAFHGRSGYTLSLTNTDPIKVKYFPKFNWPRVLNPKISFPLEDHIEHVIAKEKESIDEIKSAINENPYDIAVIILEPIQAEGGDNFFRKEFFQELRTIADENDILLMLDEVQTGFGLTGKFWTSDYYVQPDIISFGKKAQVCGIMVSDRIDEVPDNCFHVSSRINSTWGGNLVDMVRSTFIMEIIRDENLVENSKDRGIYLLKRLHQIQVKFQGLVNNARGLGLMCSFDLSDKESQKYFITSCFEKGLLILGCGEKTIRFRPPLNITDEELEEGLQVVEKVLKLMSSNK